MVYYDLPAAFKPGLEQQIVSAVNEQIDNHFKSPFDAQRAGGSLPLSPQQSQAAMPTKKDLAVELAAAEPLPASPVAIDWGAAGRLWVAEMLHYAAGRACSYQTGGRIRS